MSFFKKIKNRFKSTVTNQNFLPKFKRILDLSGAVYKKYLSIAESKSTMASFQRFTEGKYFEKSGNKIDLQQCLDFGFILLQRSVSFIICGFFFLTFLILALQDSQAENSCYKLVTKKSFLANLAVDKISYDNCLSGSEIKDLSIFRASPFNSNQYQESKNFCYKFLTRKGSIKNLLEDIILYNNCLYQARLDELSRQKKRSDIPLVELKFQRLYPTTNKEERFKYPIMPKIYNPRVDVGYHYGNLRYLGRGEFFMPILQNIDNLVFADFAMMSDSNNGKENNFGIGYRKLYKNRSIFGVYGFYDKSVSAIGTKMKQLTIGGEYLTEKSDFRLNFYLPNKDAKLTSKKIPGEAVALNENDLMATEGFFEGALGGFDFEYGFKLPFPLDELSITNGYGYFANKALNQKINRFNSRLDYIFFENDNHRLNFNLEFIYQIRKNNNADDVIKEVKFSNGSYYLGVVYSYFFGNGNSLIGPLQKKMVNRVIRDVDIVTSGKDGRKNKIADVYYITDNDPTISGLVNKAPENAAIVIKAKDDGSAYNESVLANKNGQKIYGLTFENPLRFGSTNKSICNFLACKDNKPIIDNGGTSFTVTGDNIAIGNFAVNNNSASKSIIISGSDYKIDHNDFVVNGGTALLSFGSKGKDLIINNNFSGSLNNNDYMIDVVASSNTEVVGNYFNSPSSITDTGMISFTANNSNPLLIMQGLIRNNKIENANPGLSNSAPFRMFVNNNNSNLQASIFDNFVKGYSNVVVVDTDTNSNKNLELIVGNNSYENIGSNKLDFNGSFSPEIVNQSGSGLNMIVH